MSLQRSDYEKLHKLLVDTLSARLADGSATAADLNVVRQLLKDSGIDFVEKNYDELKKLQLPFPSGAQLAADADTLQ